MLILNVSFLLSGGRAVDFKRIACMWIVCWIFIEIVILSAFIYHMARCVPIRFWIVLWFWRQTILLKTIAALFIEFICNGNCFVGKTKPFDLMIYERMIERCSVESLKRLKWANRYFWGLGTNMITIKSRIDVNNKYKCLTVHFVCRTLFHEAAQHLRNSIAWRFDHGFDGVMWQWQRRFYITSNVTRCKMRPGELNMFFFCFFFRFFLFSLRIDYTIECSSTVPKQ